LSICCVCGKHLKVTGLDFCSQSCLIKKKYSKFVVLKEYDNEETATEFMKRRNEEKEKEVK
jgi:hypothetical protein